MKLVRIEKKDSDYFAELDPFGCLEKEVPFPVFVLGAVEEDKEGDTPAGLIICYPDKSVIVVRWIYVLPGYRKQGVSDLLLNAVFEIAENEGKRYVGALIIKEYGRELVCPDEEVFFKMQGFDLEVTFSSGRAKLLLTDVSDSEDDQEADDIDEFAQNLFYEYSFDILGSDTKASEMKERKKNKSDIAVSVKDVKECDTLFNTKADFSNIEEIVSIADVSFPMLGEGIRRCCKNVVDSCFGEEIRDIPVSWYDPKLSVCSISGGAVTGLFLVHSANGTFWPEYLCASGKNSNSQCLLMVQKAAEMLIKDYPQDTKVAVHCRNQTIRGIMEKLFA